MYEKEVILTVRSALLRQNKKMPIMLSRTYQAFKAAGVSDEEAREAAEELAGFDARLIRLEVMTALILTGTITLVLKAFF